MFQSKFATCSEYQNVEETEIQDCAQLRYLLLQNLSAMAKSGKKKWFDVRKIGFCHCGWAKKRREVGKTIDVGLLYILIVGTYSKFARKNNFLALGICFPQPCSSAGRRFAASRSLYKTTDELFRFHNKKFDEIRVKLDSTENPRSFEKYPTSPTPRCLGSCNWRTKVEEQQVPGLLIAWQTPRDELKTPLNLGGMLLTMRNLGRTCI